MAKKPERIYWDACAWIGYLNEEADKISALRLVWEAAKRGHFEIWSSYYIYLEFIKGKVPYGQSYNAEEDDAKVELLLSQPFVKRTQLDLPVARLARKLRRDLNDQGLRHRPDSIHLATALHHDATELHTYDGCHLLQFNNKLRTRGGNLLKIIKPDALYFGQDLFTRVAGNGAQGGSDEE